ncbi:MAG TPA: hypothetical protein VKD65_11780 [Candidatus Angelobacter sp.]|nr:hypothetical protein [Candidatus Angelobacter sp.]
MSSQDKSAYDDQLLIRYLLGELPAEETERLDELSIADEEVAARLSGVENDLVDAYVRAEVKGEDLRRFESFYLSSANRREKVQFARALLTRERGTATAPAMVIRTGVAPPQEPDKKSSPRRGLQWPWPALQLGFASAAAVLLIMAGYLLVDNMRLHEQMRESRNRQSEFDRRERDLRSELDQQRSAYAQAQEELQHFRDSQSNLELTTAPLLLLPPSRSVSAVPAISLRPGTDLVVLLLTLESDDFPAYRVVLKDPATRQIRWRSATVTATSAGEKKVVSVSFRAGLLKPQNYIAELTGISAQGSSELIAGYPFRAVLK